MMELILVTGGVRSGKSRWAQDAALARGGLLSVWPPPRTRSS